MAGGFVGGAGEAVGKAATDQVNSALELKLMSAKLETEHQNRLYEFAANQAAEEKRYAREHNVSKGVGEAAGRMLNQDLGPLTSNDQGVVDAMLKAKIARDQQSVVSSPVPDEVGIPQYNIRHNMLGFQVGSPTPVPDYATKRANYDKLQTYNTLLTRAGALFDNLSTHNALGAGSIFNHIPENLAKERAELGDINKQLGPLSAGTIEGVPGERFSQMLGEAMSTSQPLAQHDVQVGHDHLNNAKLMIYAKIRDISPLAVMPQDLTDKFGGLTHDQDGRLLNPHDISIIGDNVYYAGSAAPVGNLKSPFLAVHPHAAQAFAKHVAGQATQGAQSSFGSPEDAAAFLSRQNQGK